MEDKKDIVCPECGSANVFAEVKVKFITDVNVNTGVFTTDKKFPLEEGQSQEVDFLKCYSCGNEWDLKEPIEVNWNTPLTPI